ncbi:peptidylprolyl isomerase [Wukongibacter baidiensis]|uniref:peptidylprolyl isomerase n=1 Tax=Wukongibacter baidiensis TaxID=1723361 RepID=UPI003D7FA8D2
MFQINKRVLSIALVLMLLMTTLAACQQPEDKPTVDENVIAKVNGENIYLESFTKNFVVVEKRYNEWYTENIWSQEINGKTVLEIVKGQVLDKLITEELIKQEADKKGIKVDEAKVEETYTTFKERLDQDETLKTFYAENNLDDEFVKKQISMEMLVSEYEKTVIDELGLKGEKLDEITKDYVVQVRAKHILIKDETKAKEILEKAKAGEDFTTLAKENSEDPSAKDNNGDLGFFPRNAMVPEFEEAAFSLNIGEISELVKTEYGYHIIKVEGKKTISDLKDEISEEELAMEKKNVEAKIIQDKFIEKIEELKSNAEIEKFEENLK